MALLAFLAGLLCCLSLLFVIFICRRKSDQVAVMTEGPDLTVGSAHEIHMCIPYRQEVASQVTPREEVSIIVETFADVPPSVDVYTDMTPRELTPRFVEVPDVVPNRLEKSAGMSPRAIMSSATQITPRQVIDAPKIGKKRGAGIRRDKAPPKALLYHDSSGSSDEESHASVSTSGSEESN